MKIYEIIREDITSLYEKFNTYLTTKGKKLSNMGGMIRADQPANLSATVQDLVDFLKSNNLPVSDEIYRLKDINRQLLTIKNFKWFTRNI